MEKLSIIVPVYNEEVMVPIFTEAVENIRKNELPNIMFEYWFIDDGSSDATLEELRKLQAKMPEQVHYVSFSRNFGKEAALYAGLQKATGDYVAVMDVDLQDPPELLPEMVNGVASGEYDCVGTRRTTRDGEPPIRTFFSKLFYKLINRISSTQIVEGARDYRVMSRQVVSALLRMTEYNRFSKGMFSWVGFNTKYLEFENKDRVAGETSWSFWSLLKYSIEGIVNFSQAPLVLVSVLGLLSCAGSVIAALFLAARTMFTSAAVVSGWTSMIVIILFMGGIQLLSIGIVGRYISNIYLEVKNRPIYLSKEER
ncbi:glycosyltransferase family 2 protein [Weissella tructae]|uniref:CsbB_2 protein n=2 Tax=Weissella TaxID=46255 RepID=A0A075TVX8_9LACO|nr:MULTISPECIES: glycosyltransferase family 2 protein [Weissella]AIG65714.1 CsbB_2 protein [Weissella tructae]AIM63030.1 CsbB_2 protein [Weissella ceti]AIM64429.1 CsbB_2 protein [Weissella ceti]ELA06833.1 glycosyltransferase [Weissella ceti NC36]QVV90880.1 glycosyltransferase family 2 protein [Weissella tructae]